MKHAPRRVIAVAHHFEWMSPVFTDTCQKLRYADNPESDNFRYFIDTQSTQVLRIFFPIKAGETLTDI